MGEYSLQTVVLQHLQLIPRLDFDETQWNDDEQDNFQDYSDGEKDKKRSQKTMLDVNLKQTYVENFFRTRLGAQFWHDFF